MLTKKTEDGENSKEEQVVLQQEGAELLELVPANIKVYFDRLKVQMNELYASMTSFYSKVSIQTELSMREIELKSVQDNIEDKMQNFEYKKSILVVDMVTVKKQVRQVSLSRIISKLLHKKAMNESANLGLPDQFVKSTSKANKTRFAVNQVGYKDASMVPERNQRMRKQNRWKTWCRGLCGRARSKRRSEL